MYSQAALSGSAVMPEYFRSLSIFAFLIKENKVHDLLRSVINFDYICLLKWSPLYASPFIFPVFL